MIRAALLLLLLTPADWTDCTPVPTGPIVSQRPEQPFVRKPDEAAIRGSGFGTTTDDDWPPMRYRRIGSSAVVFTEQAGIERLCGKSHPPFISEACANDDEIVLPDPCTFRVTDDYARLACHELAHRFGGWPSNHPR